MMGLPLFSSQVTEWVSLESTVACSKTNSSTTHGSHVYLWPVWRLTSCNGGGSHVGIYDYINQFSIQIGFNLFNYIDFILERNHKQSSVGVELQLLHFLNFFYIWHRRQEQSEKQENNLIYVSCLNAFNCINLS